MNIRSNLVQNAAMAYLASTIDRCNTRSGLITLGKLREVLESLHEMRVRLQRVPSTTEVAEILGDFGLSQLPLSTVEILVNTIEEAGESDVLASLTLKRLEELMGRIHNVRSPPVSVRIK